MVELRFKILNIQHTWKEECDGELTMVQWREVGRCRDDLWRRARSSMLEINGRRGPVVEWWAVRGGGRVRREREKENAERREFSLF
jgi:hypothetical protein